MAVDNVVVQSQTDLAGNNYTSAISNDTLTNDDFLKLMLEEMRMQDPTKPMDSNALMDSQLQMSQIQTNSDMSKAMAELSASYKASNLSTAAGLIGNVIENGEVGEDGLIKSYIVETVETNEGEMYLSARQMTGLTDTLVSVDGEDKTALVYDSEGNIYEDGDKIDLKVEMGEDGRFVLDENSNITLRDANGDVVTDAALIAKYKYNGTSIDYSATLSLIPLSGITKVR